jgi:hypothetical protein
MAEMVSGIVFTAAYIIYFKFKTSPQQRRALVVQDLPEDRHGRHAHQLRHHGVVSLRRSAPQEPASGLATLRYPKSRAARGRPGFKVAAG